MWSLTGGGGLVSIEVKVDVNVGNPYLHLCRVELSANNWYTLLTRTQIYNKNLHKHPIHDFLGRFYRVDIRAYKVMTCFIHGYIRECLFTPYAWKEITCRRSNSETAKKSSNNIESGGMIVSLATVHTNSPPSIARQDIDEGDSVTWSHYHVVARNIDNINNKRNVSDGKIQHFNNTPAGSNKVNASTR